MKFKSPNFNKIPFNFNLILTLILLLVLLYEAYMVYNFVYLNLKVNPDQIVPSNVVRVDLGAYKNTIDYLDAQKNFKAPSLSFPRSNPFRP